MAHRHSEYKNVPLSCPGLKEMHVSANFSDLLKEVMKSCCNSLDDYNVLFSLVHPPNTLLQPTMKNPSTSAMNNFDKKAS